jgi:hypothetical protein
MRRFLACWFARRQINRVREPEQKANIGTRFFPWIYAFSISFATGLLGRSLDLLGTRACAMGQETQKHIPGALARNVQRSIPCEAENLLEETGSKLMAAVAFTERRLPEWVEAHVHRPPAPQLLESFP